MFVATSPLALLLAHPLGHSMREKTGQEEGEKLWWEWTSVGRKIP